MTAAASLEDRTATRADLRHVAVGAWTLEYLGPGFRVQVRVTGRGPSVQVSGWMSPAIAARVFLVAMAHREPEAEAEISASGRFEFAGVPTGGGYRLAFLLDDADRPFLTPPFWA